MLTEYHVHGVGAWNSTIEDGELTLQSVRYVISSTTRMNHGCQKHAVCYYRKITRSLQAVEACKTFCRLQ